MTSNFFLFKFGRASLTNSNGMVSMVSSFNRNVMLSPSTVRHNLFYSHLEEGSVNGEAVEAEPYVSVPYLMREVVA